VTGSVFDCLLSGFLNLLPPQTCDLDMAMMLRHLLAPGHSHGGFEVEEPGHEEPGHDMHGEEEHMEAAEYTLDLR
jgi:hypothetical protein